MAQVIAVYPAMTSEVLAGEIVAPRFFWLARQIRQTLALERVQMTNAVALAVGMVMGDRDKVLRLAEQDVTEAFPHG